ncbi:phosphatidylserine decarboxylase family protein [Pseudomonas syringae pv. aptata]|uniref:phosphatidylserine decarboxylase family protein n=1 Tax=Pseudomonas syringae TaxID=317 RepID=UPI0002A7AB38|nr:phosphatidylserine decarboxylase family protein [Pseudomonas syringae]ELP95901.1 phosphatidylserine decarboxylase [Pseudomonas syringae BRIP34881]ELP96268.1 phosphatidylserine decarboxylase [Pseudomonas syringae BRIP34876]KZL36229.1 phosphatidylserine decarboxylase [Pseudomonas syringae pv. syringae]MBI6707815.1 phophatidylserine decarboxylase associated domain-containing protein [Pseudomonas syringae]MBI6817559.1 phophatidylserine decarboxylase associated domain-containing protein [Pseudom
MSNTVLIPGHLPQVRIQVNTFLTDIKEELSDTPSGSEGWSVPVQALEDLLAQDPIIRMYVSDMFMQVPEEHRVVSCVSELLVALELISTRAPVYSSDPARANFFPVSTLFVYMMMTPAGQAVFRIKAFNDCIRVILKSWCIYLDSPQSRDVLHTGDTGWLSPSSCARHNMDEYLIPDRSDPHWGFDSFNAFFHRKIKPECRPVSEPGNTKAIVSANDGTLYKVAHGVKDTDQFWIKSQPYSLEHMMAGDPLAHLFQGGTVFQSFLDGRNYHRFQSPIAGTIKKVVKIEGLMFSNAESAGEDLTAGTYSQAYMTCVNTRCLVFVESTDPDVGTICLIAVGLSEVSSISASVDVGQCVEKGDELGYFSYGGSSICLLFQAGKIREFTIDINDTGTQVGTRGAVLRAGQKIASC